MSVDVEDRVVGGSSARATAVHTSVVPLLDAKGAGALLNVPASWVLAEARADRIPYVRLGRYVRFDAAELQTWWQPRRRGPWRARGGAATVARGGVTSAPTANGAV
jgi:excisionase family DNA binding protein